MNSAKKPALSSMQTSLLLIFIFCSTLLQTSPVEGGVCWSTVTSDGRCKDVIQRGVSSQEECCQIVGGAGAWTPEDYDSAQTFFWDALGGGAPNCKTCSKSCDSIKCPDDKVCSINNGAPRCTCPTNCPTGTQQAPLTPVCSAEGITFRSECHMRKRNCREGLKDWISYQGHCQYSCDMVKCREDQHCIVDSNHQPYCVRCMANCPKLYVPMCGTDGVTYDSMCRLNQAACQNKSKNIKYAHHGSCKASATCSEVKCSKSEVCILDSRQNLPRCVRCDLNCSSSAGNSPVCGSDGVTYANWCQLRENSCTFGVLIHVERIGGCQEKTPSKKARR